MKSSESSSTSMIDKKRFTELISPKSFKSEGHADAHMQLRCFYCTKSNFSTIEQLNVHINLMHSHKFVTKEKKSEFDAEVDATSSYKSCEFCLMKFSTSEKLLKHLKQIHQNREKDKSSVVDVPMETEEQPTDLSQRFAKKIKLENIPKPMNLPIKSPTTTDVFLCNQCNASLPNFELFRLHLKSHLEENYNTVNRANEPSYEMNNLLFNNGQKKFICHQCRDVVFDNRYEYDQHMEKHFTEFVCRECEESFPKNDELQNHLLENHVCFKCTLCSETLESIMSLKLHFASRHSHKKCSACHEDFASDREFKNHVHTKHISTEAIRCIFCRVTCSSEIEMHFHFLSNHVKQFR
jgi:zinc finger protein 423